MLDKFKSFMERLSAANQERNRRNQINAEKRRIEDNNRLRQEAEEYANKYYTFFIPGFAGYISAGRPDLVPKAFIDSTLQGKNYSEAAKDYIIHEYMRTGKKPKW